MSTKAIAAGQMEKWSTMTMVRGVNTSSNVGMPPLDAEVIGTELQSCSLPMQGMGITDGVAPVLLSCRSAAHGPDYDQLQPANWGLLDWNPTKRCERPCFAKVDR